MQENKEIQKYLDALTKIAAEIQESDQLATFREDEEDESFKALAEAFEPRLMEIHTELANHYPLGLVAFETAFTNEDLEGLLLPRLLGFSVLRGYYDQNYKYFTPQDHFKTLILAIAESANFDNIKNRIGQTVQIGFALSSDIWISNLLDQIENKKVKQWLQSQKLEKYHVIKERQTAYTKYKNQFHSYNYYTATIPTNLGELKLYFPSLKYFLFQRQRLRLDNSNIKPAITRLLKNPAIAHTSEFDQIMFILMNFFNLEEGDKQDVATIFNEFRRNDAGFADEYFDFLIEMYENKTILGPDSDKKVMTYFDPSITDDISAYYAIVEQLHTKGFMHADVMESIREYLGNYKGLSHQAEAIRQAVMRYFKQWIDNAGYQDYQDYFEYFKVYEAYMDMFGNEHFNQQLGQSSMAYMKRLLTYFTDKRGRDYQDIKKFMATSFTAAGFLKEKEVVEMFKTKRKPKTADN